jgi:hypothetical protein
MIDTLITTAGYWGTFCLADYAITYMFGFQNIYYLLHSIHNALIVAACLPDVLITLFDFGAVGVYAANLHAAQLVVALHLYHIWVYRHKFRYDDWLHHGLMIGVALPIGMSLPAGTLLGYSLFFTTGLPGGIDYAMLFMNRNGWLDRSVEKRVNTWLNTWIRSPGCVSQAAFTLAYLSSNSPYVSWWMILGGILTAALNYWNGQYFMRQVVEDYGRRAVTNE